MRRYGPEERKELIEALRVEFGIDQPRREDRFYLRREYERIADSGVVKRLQPDAVTSGKKGLLDIVPDRERKHSVQLVEALFTPSAKSFQQNLGVRCRRKPLALGFKLVANISVVIDLAVVGEGVSLVSADERLMAGGGCIDDRETPMTRDEILAGVAQVAREHLGFEGGLSPSARLVEDLGLDSIRLVTLAAEVENHFRILLEPEEEAAIATVGDLVETIAAKLG